MEAKRVTRAVIDPKVRQVGFITASDPPHPSVIVAGESPPSGESPVGSTLSPVMIPPPLGDVVVPAGRSNPVPVPVSSSPLRRGGEVVATGSYNANSEFILAGSVDGSVPSLEFSGEMITPSPKWVGRTSSAQIGFSNKAEEFVQRSSSLGASFTVASSVTSVAVAKLPPGIQEVGTGGSLELETNKSMNSKPLKERTSKAERRALQEAQRAAKVAAKEAGGNAPAAPSRGTSKDAKPASGLKPASLKKKDVAPTSSGTSYSEKKGLDRAPDKDKKKDVLPPRMQFDDTQRVEKAKKRAVVKQTETRNRVELFRHLPQFVHGSLLSDLESKFFQVDSHQVHPHPAIYKVGLQFLSGDISGGNARCVAMLLAFQEVIKDYSTPPEKALDRDLTLKINSYISFLIACRPLSISMGNAIRFLKERISKLSSLALSESDAKSMLLSDIDRFINEKIILADQVIVTHAVAKIRDGDVLLTHGFSTLVEMILLHAHESRKVFRVVIVDSRPKLEGKLLLRRLVAKGINCTYTHIAAVSYIMHEVTKVLLGAASVLSNGTVYSRVGTSCVAMVAHAFRVPVIICCEAYKFHERVQLDSICSNELGDPDLISKVYGSKEVNSLENWAETENLYLLNLMYDATPSDYVSMVITDYGMVPPTSVPVIVREYGGWHSRSSSTPLP